MIVVVLLQNVALLVALSVAQQFIQLRWHGGPFGKQIVSGVLFGAVTISGMLTPLHLGEGVIFDGRSIVLSIAGLFGGPIVAVTAGGMAAAYRVWLGGGGTLVGVATIVEAASLGVAFHYLRRLDPRVVRPWRLWGFSVLVHVIMLAIFLGLPGDPLHDTLPRIAGPILVFYPLGVVLIGRFLVEQENRYLTTITAGQGSEITQFLAENTVDCIWLVDMDLVFRYVNPAIESMFGYKAEEFLGTKVSEYVSAEDMQDLSKVVEQTIRALPDNPAVQFQSDFLKSDGEYLPVEVVGRLLVEAHGRPIAFCGSTRDISDRRRAEREERRSRDMLEALVQERTEELQAVNEELRAANEELQAVNEELRAANDAKNRFLRAMSHELRTPLNSVIGFSDILAKGIAGPVNSEQRRQAKMINHSGQHLLALINDILDLSRIEADKLQFDFVRFDIAALAEEALDSVASDAAAHGVKTLLEVPSDLVMIRSDPLKVRQILLNLIGNAVKFTEHGSVIVRIHQPRHGTLAIDIVDTGPGIPPEEHGRIFEEFVQADSGEEASRTGSGLGLAIALGLTRALGGALTLESEVGKGSTFTVALPVEN